MRGIGAFLILIGFGSLLLPLFDMQFTILAPLEDFQPVAGIVLGIVGLGLLVLPSFLAGRREIAPSEAPADLS
jgi:hypothetical protein